MRRPEDEGHQGRPLRSKGLLPALGVGAAVYFVAGVSLTTLGLVGIGAGVGYGVGSWLADKLQKKPDANRGGQQNVPLEQLPWAVQVALQQWQDFVTRRAAGRQLQQSDVDILWAEFERVEPTHAMNARLLVRGTADASSSSGVPVVQYGAGGPVIVATQAAEV